MSAALSLSWPQPNVAQLTFDLPGKGVNILSRLVMEELAGHLRALQARPETVGLIIHSGKPGTFIAGADIHEFTPHFHSPKDQIIATSRQGQELFQLLSQLPFVTIAAIEGICVGGGAELAVWCDHRLFSSHPKTEFGFPEVKLGLFPGWGGTVRGPRLVGLANAVELICSGESITAQTAVRSGWGTDIVASERLLPAALELVAEEHRTGGYRALREHHKKPLELNPTELGFLAATAAAQIQQETKGSYPAPPAALELMLETSALPVEAALAREATGFAELFGSPVNVSLVNVFTLHERNRRDTGLERRDVSPRNIGSLGIIGAGIMGAGIAAASVKAEFPVALVDANAAALEKGTRQVIEEVAYDKQTKKPDAERALRFAPLLHSGSHDDDLASSDLIIEAIVENADAKRQLFARLEPQLRPEVVLASNTSTLPISKLAAGLQHPERFCGIHFFNPVRRMKLVEVIRGQQTSDETVATAVAYAKRIGKMPVVVNDGPGFLVNRILFPYMNEAIELLLDGVSPREIDKAALAFGMPIGPVALYDLVGLDTALYAGRTMWEAFPKRVLAAPLVPALVKAGRLGQKTGRGFYRYDNKKGRAEDDPAVQPIIDTYRRPTRKVSKEEITHRMILSMLLEATRVLDDNVARDVRDIDLGVIFGLGFPPFRGGLLFWADTVGASQILDWLKPLENLGPRLQPSERLLGMAARGEHFYPSTANPVTAGKAGL